MPLLRFFPVAYEVADRPVLVAGGGEAALNKLRLLARSKARLTVVAPELEPEVAHLVESRGISHVARELAPCDLFGVALLFVATGDEASDSALSRMARTAGIPVNVVDRPHLSDFAVPAIVDRAPIAVAISTDGVAPVLAQRIRASIEAMLHPEFGRLGELARSIRGHVMERIEGPLLRRRFWSSLFDGRAADLALAGDLAGARREAERLLARDGVDSRGIVWLIGAGPGAADLLTLRAQRLLQIADVVVHDHLVPLDVIDMARRDAERISVGKAKRSHSATQAEINALLVRLACEGKRVARLKAGDPLVFGRAGEELAALREAGIAHDIVPGITAALAAAADARIPLTLRGVSSSLVFATAHGAEGSEPAGWVEVARAGGTVAVYMGRTAGREILERLAGAGLSPTTPVVAIENAGRTSRRLFAGTLGDIPHLSARPDLSGPVMILCGPAVSHADIAAAEDMASRIADAA